MSRRYLMALEAASALERGKAVDAFLGPCEREGKHGIRWLQFRKSRGGVELHVFESADSKSHEFTDVYEFAPLDPSLYDGDASQVEQFLSFDQCLAAVEAQWPGVSKRLVNEFVIQEEYADFLRNVAE
jgi:hypothetical protein